MDTKEFQLNELLNFQSKSHRKAGDGLESGTYPFFTSSQQQTKWFDEADYKIEAIILGTGGAPSVHFAKNFSTSADVFILTPKNNKISARYVSYFLRSDTKILECGFKGAGLKHLSRNYTEKIHVPIPVDGNGNPDIKEQERVVALLQETEDLKKKRAETDHKMSTVIPALFSKMFGDIRSNSKKWPMVHFGEIGSARLGKMLDAKKQTGKNRKPYIKNTNVKWGYFDLNDLPEMDFTEKEQNEFRLKSGDLLICEGGEIGRAAIWRDEIQECYFQKALHRVRLDPKKATPEYIAVLLKTMADNKGFRELIGIATIPHLTGVQLASIKVPLPPIELQHKFTKIVNEVRIFENKQKKSAENIHKLSSSVIAKTFV